MRPIIVTLIWILVTSLLITASAFTQTSADQVINRFISSQAKAADGEEYPDARKVLRGDINGDGREDLVVLYTLEGFGGSNNYHQYIAVFLGSSKTYRHAAHAVVGGKLYRDVELTSISSGIINLDTKEYRTNDPACCPSRAAKTRYALRSNKLIEIKR